LISRRRRRWKEEKEVSSCIQICVEKQEKREKGERATAADKRKKKKKQAAET